MVVVRRRNVAVVATAMFVTFFAAFFTARFMTFFTAFFATRFMTFFATFFTARFVTCFMAFFATRFATFGDMMPASFLLVVAFLSVRAGDQKRQSQNSRSQS